jgi:hypothetical protein
VKLAIERSADPRLTERFLLTQPEVIEASVWFEHGELNAFVTLIDSARVSARDLRIECASNLGLELTPKHFVLQCARPKAA